MTATFGIVAFVVAIIVSIMVHEWGHFSTARRFGMRADKFFLGFGPTMWSIQRGETEYGVKALPAGGFVRVRGMARHEVRRPGVGTAWVADEQLAIERRDEAADRGIDVLSVALLTEAARDRLDLLLDERGASESTRAAIIERVWSERPSTATEAERAVDRAVDEIVPAVDDDVAATDPERLSSMHHRLRFGDRGRFFHDRPAWQRAIVLVAGSFWHFVIAIVLLFGGLLLLPQATGEATNEVGGVVADSPADAAGLQVGDRVVAIDGTRSDNFLALREVIRANAGTAVSLTVERGGETLDLSGTPTASEDGGTGETVGQLGFVPVERRERMSVGDAAWATFVGPTSIPAQVGLSFSAIGDVFGPEGIGQLFDEISGAEERSPEAISMVGGASMTGQGVAAVGVMFLIVMVVGVNVFIGVLNLLPLPPLDGGHLAVLGIEVATNRVRGWMGRSTDFAVDQRTVAAVALPVLLVLATVGLGLIWLDIVNPIQLR